MGLFVKSNGPVMYKDSDDSKKQLEELKNLRSKAIGETKRLIEQDIKLLEYGIKGEENVAFELMNSFMPMLILRDLHYEYEGLSAQIDFLVITRKLILVIECKNLFGDIEVNSNGDFIRTLEFDSKKKREGIYSPITQNRRHLEIIKAMKKSDISNAFIKMMFDKFFEDNYKSIIVLANPKTIIDVSMASKDVRDQIIRNDQLVTFIKELSGKSKSEQSNDKTMYELAESFVKYHKPLLKDYTSKYKMVEASNEIENKVDQSLSIEDSPLYKELKSYRLDKSKEENIKAYYVFTNAQLEELIQKMPDSIESIKCISGFGDVKASKYGTDLLAILKKYRQ